jgi:hypothetical protein
MKYGTSSRSLFVANRFAPRSPWKFVISSTLKRKKIPTRIFFLLIFQKGKKWFQAKKQHQTQGRDKTERPRPYSVPFVVS